MLSFDYDPPKLYKEDIFFPYCVVCSFDATLRSPKSGGTNNANALETVLGVPWFSTVSNNNISQLRKEVLPERRQKWIFKNTQTHHSEKLANLCANKVGNDATLNEFGRLGRETGVKEYNSLIRICIERAKDCDLEDVALEEHICKAFLLFNFMKEQGFQLEEETYGPLLIYLIDMGMIEEFHFFRKAIESGNSRSDPRLGYYEMLLWIKVNDEEKIQELCNCTAIDYEGDFCIVENYLLALCESKRNSEFLQLLETVDITKVSSLDHVMSIFKFLGRLVLESFAEKYLLALKISEYEAENVSNVIFSYTFGIPNLEVEDIISKFKDLHAKLEIKPSYASYEKLIAYTCDLYANLALDIVDEMSEAGLTPSIDTINSIPIAFEKYFSYALVQRAYLIICHHNLKPNSETFRRMISLSVKMEDFDGAYAMLCDEKKMNLMLTADMYNAIMDGYFQKEDMAGALKVFKQMEKADVKPNCQTFSYLIKNCSNEKDIVKYYEEMTCSGVQVTKQVFMALITAYASCGEFEKAKQVILDKGIPVESLNEIKGSLVVALASNGQKFDALVIYEEIKQAGWRLKPEDAFELLPHLHSEEELSILVQLLEDTNDSAYWMDVCEATIACAVRFKSLSYAVPLLKQLKDKIKPSRFVSEGFLFQVFSEIAEEPTDLQFGLDFLRIMKNELDIALSPECFNFLLSVCVKEKNLQIARLICKEYKTANLPYITFSCLWMYRALLVSGDRWGARKILSKIPKDDPHIRRLIRGDHENWVELEAYWGPSFSFLPRTSLQGVA
ncbi:pentatricopeptide repeat-containing protein At4g04790, mitochondrial-like [Pistacia vera]|uniref:pentatricopeptide repeat-containing protein At4g04790, mitochondrial-like n=1 Tax=Pistacia vera TaxID=55513 RepID=UPI001263D202|nr:pentatricopeptide repeat-containing protein At4g04790, mitochondrial-like [Pistacia vera]